MIGCASFVRELSLVHLWDPGLLLVTGWPRAIWTGAASREWPAGGVATCAGVAASFGVCGTLGTHSSTLSGNRSFQVWVKAEWETPGLPGDSPGVWEGRRTRGSPFLSPGRPGGVRGSSRRPISPCLSAWACLAGSCGTSAVRPRHLLLSQKGREQRRLAPSEVGLDPWPPRCEL